MSLYTLSPELWALSEESDRRYHRLLVSLAVPALILGIAMPYLKLAGLQRGGGEPLPPRYAKLLEQTAPPAEETEEPTPAETPQKPTPTQKTQVKPKPEVTQEQRVAQARAKASKLLNFADDLADLRTTGPSYNLIHSNNPSAASSTNIASSSAIEQAAMTTSGGIGETGTVERSESGTGVGKRRTIKIEKPQGFAPDPTRAGQGGDKYIAGRSLKEIQAVFDRNQGAFYVLYTRALREFPDMRGKVVVRLTISPSGAVVECKLVSSELRNPELEKKVVQRILLLNFGAKSVPAITIERYPLIFQPLG